MGRSPLKNKAFGWLLAFAACLAITGYFHQGSKIDRILWYDQEGYYIYLPAVFIYGGFENVPCLNGCGTANTVHGPRTFTKYTYGVALMESPFFLAAHAIAPILDYPRDGRSLPYIWSLLCAAIFYMLAGIGILQTLLRELKFSERISWITPIGILVGTNLFYYTFGEAGMSHVYSFFLFSVLIYASHRKQTSGGAIWNVLTSWSLALIILVRPSNAIAVLIPVFWNASLAEFPSRIRKFAADGRWVLANLTAITVVFIPQLIYWKLIRNNFLFYSYTGESFSNWNSPKMLQVLFSPQNGWLVYSPLVILGLIGIALMAKNKVSGWLLPTMLLFLATYVFGSWWMWWFGGAYGHRCFVDYLPPLAVPAAYLLTKTANWSKWGKYALGLVIFVAVFINIRMADIYNGMWNGADWGWHSYLQKLANAFYIFN